MSATFYRLIKHGAAVSFRIAFVYINHNRIFPNGPQLTLYIVPGANNILPIQLFLSREGYKVNGYCYSSLSHAGAADIKYFSFLCIVF